MCVVCGMKAGGSKNVKVEKKRVMQNEAGGRKKVRGKAKIK